MILISSSSIDISTNTVIDWIFFFDYTQKILRINDDSNYDIKFNGKNIDIVVAEKAINIDPKFVNALQNITFLVMGDDEKAIGDYNAKRKAGNIDEANKIIEARRQRFAKALPYAEKWYTADPTNVDAVSLLRSFYTSAKNTTKAAEFKAKEEALRGGK